MENMENYVQIEVHNKIMQSLRERELQYKTKIIELQKQKQYQANRANQFQQKFKEAMLSSGDQVSLIQKLSEKENENYDLRMEVLRLKKCIDISSENSLNPKNTSDETPSVKQLLIQNQEMAKTIEQLKTAAISAIMSKDDQIQELNEKIAKAQELAILYQNLLDREDSLQKYIQKIRAEADEQLKILSQKLVKEREKYLQKIEEFQNNLHHQQSSKQELMQKAELLENNLLNNEQIIQLYQGKLNEYEAAFRQEKNVFDQQKEKLHIQIDNLKDKHTIYEKQIGNLEKLIQQYNSKEKQFKLLNQALKQQNTELQRKLSIKKRKNNPTLKSSDIYSSFEGISQKSSFYSSFYKPSEPVKPTTLGQIDQMEENDIIDSFIDLQRVEEPEEEKKPTMKKNKKAQQVEISPNIQIPIVEPQEKVEPEKDELQTQLQINSVSEPEAQKQKTPETVERQQKTIVTQNSTAPSKQHLLELQNLKNTIESYSTEIKTLRTELQSLKHTLLQSKEQTKIFKQRNQALKENIQTSYKQIQRLTKEIQQKNSQIHSERQALAQLRSQNKKSQSQKELIVELQNYKQHVYKLQNALLIEKLQNAQKQQFVKQRSERQRKNYDEKIAKLNEEVKLLSPKKKKGFFR